MAIHAVVPAAGIGSRMQSSLPKQYLPLAGRPVLAHTLERLSGLPSLASLTVAVASEDTWWQSTRELLHDSRIVSCEGGQDRAQSVLNALRSLADHAADTDWVLVHDAVRPCVRTADIERLLDAVTSSAAVGGLLATPVSDTLKRAGNSSDAFPPVVETVDRQLLWNACTPQLFPLGVLTDCLQRAASAQVTLTDEASALEWAGYAPLLVPCARDNIKITYPEDLALAELIIKQYKGNT